MRAIIFGMIVQRLAVPITLPDFVAIGNPGQDVIVMTGKETPYQVSKVTTENPDRPAHVTELSAPKTAAVPEAPEAPEPAATTTETSRAYNNEIEELKTILDNFDFNKERSENHRLDLTGIDWQVIIEGFKDDKGNPKNLQFLLNELLKELDKSSVKDPFNYADLSNADLRGAVLQRANLQGADLQGTRLQGAVLQGANLLGVLLQGPLQW